MSNEHADGYRKGWTAALETVLREVEDLPSERLEGGGSIDPDAFGKWVVVVGLGNVVGIVRDALEALD